MKAYTKEQIVNILKKKWIKEFRKLNSKAYFMIGFVDDALDDETLDEVSYFVLSDSDALPIFQPVTKTKEKS